MIPFDPVISCQLPLIRKIIADETWLEGERRGCGVSPDDPVVRDKVCQVILRVGQQLREEATRRAALEPGQVGEWVQLPDQTRAA